MNRVARLRDRLTDPFLVTTPVNVLYLTGFDSSNAALLVGGERAVLFSDFRYAEAARHVEGVEFVEVERALLPGVRDHLDGRVEFEAGQVTYAGWDTLREGGAELVPTTGVVERMRAVKDEAELATIRRAAAVTNEAYERLAQERFVGRRSASWPGGWRRSCTRRARRGKRFRRSSPAARTERFRTRARRTASSRQERRSWSTPARRWMAMRRTARARLRRASSTKSCAAHTASACRRSRSASTRLRRASPGAPQTRPLEP